MPETFTQAKMNGMHHVGWTTIDGVKVLEPVNSCLSKACCHVLSTPMLLAANKAMLLVVLVLIR